MVLTAEEDGEEADDLAVVSQVKIEDRAVFGNATEAGADFGAAGALVGRAGWLSFFGRIPYINAFPAFLDTDP